MKSSFFAAVVSLSLLWMAAGTSLAETHAVKAVVPVKVDGSATIAGVELQLDMQVTGREMPESQTIYGGRADIPDAKSFPIGSNIKVCFKANEEGFITLWSVDSSGARTVIYPNKYAFSGERAAPVQKNERICLGDSKEFLFKIAEPLGRSQIYAHWTRTKEETLSQEMYPAIGKAARDVRAVAAPGPYVSKTIEYVTTKP